MEYDIIIVGAGPAGCAAGIRLKQLAQFYQKPLSVCILEKGARVGAHLLAGAVLNPKSLQTLLPDTWQQAPLNAPVKKDGFYLLSKHHALRLPTPPQMKNHGNYLIRLGQFGEFLGQEAEKLGCEIYPGFSAVQTIFNDNNQVIGIKTGDMGVDKHNQPTDQYQPGMTLHAKLTLFAEGCRGQLTEQLIKHYQLRRQTSPQSYGLGIKELWQIPSPRYEPGTVLHSVGWPLDHATYGGSFIYYLQDNLVAIGFVVGLDYKNPYLSPFQEFQRFKTHPWVKSMLQGGERIGYGAKALNEGGWQAIPKLTFPGGALIGDGAGFLNVPQIKGIHTAIQSGIFAAEASFETAQQASGAREPLHYPTLIQTSWVKKELWQARNIRPGFRYGLIPGLCNAAFETYITKGRSPWTLSHRPDYTSLRLAADSKLIEYPKPDGILTFDRLSSVYLTNTFHAENQPCHLKLGSPALAIEVNFKQYASPETRYCPAAVYEIVDEATHPRLQINAQNCIHCKTCDIKDPRQNIIWTAPEGGGGPNYSGM
ncbi:MAG: electron transfer flavoprotein-ubiquinone oxidoreductase [Gammaproteobacteria bacterium]|nr:electron transfer flavoprotein-ubiquinone oxidoreductase [Gammaproteobacteria bacterium]